MNNPYTLKESAVAIHEMYLSLRQAGFTRREALALISALILEKPLEP